MSSTNQTRGTIAVIGAGGGGIGTAIAIAAASEGFGVVAVDQDAPRLALATDQIEARGGRVQAELCDAGNDADVRALFDRLAAQYVDLGGLVNVVGGLALERWHALVDEDEENIEALLETNLRIAIRTSRAFARTQIAAAADAPGRTSSIVQIASIAALQGMPFGAGYAASKAALLSYTRTMALEWGGFGIRVNAVAPGTITVPKNQDSQDADQDERAIPLGRRGMPEDVAQAVVFLLSPASSWITGQTLAVDGGASIKPSYLDDDGLPIFVRDEALRRRLTKD